MTYAAATSARGGAKGDRFIIWVVLTMSRVLVCRVRFFFSSRRRHTRFDCDWSSDVCSSDLMVRPPGDRADRPGVPRAAPTRGGGRAGAGLHPLPPYETPARARARPRGDARGQRGGNGEGGGRGPDATRARGCPEQSPDAPLRGVG